jgi:hypothetical protein
MVEASRGTQEARGEEDELASSAWGRRGGKALLDDGPDAADVDQVEVQRALAGGVEAAAAVLVAESQELLGLTEVGPGEGRDEQALQEAADVGAEATALANHAVGVAHSVG